MIVDPTYRHGHGGTTTHLIPSWVRVWLAGDIAYGTTFGCDIVCDGFRMVPGPGIEPESPLFQSGA